PIFDHEIRPRGITDLQRMGLAPTIPGLLAGDGTEAPEGVKTMVAVSHSHLDHVGMLPYLRHEIPLLLTEDTHKLLLALDDVAFEGPEQPLHYVPVSPGSVTEFGPFTITTVLVDHDTPGACGFLIETPEVRFAYTGDLRLHGAHPERTEEFARLAQAFKPDVLFIEGTRARSENNDEILVEKDVQERLIEVIRDTDHGVYFTFYPRHPERLTAFAEAARKTGRKLVVDARSAYIYEKFGGDVSSFAIYGGSADTWTEVAERWVKESGLQVIEPRELCGQEQRYVLEMPYHRLVDFLDIEAKAGGFYIHSNGAPLGPYDPRWDNFMFWLNRFGLIFESVGSTGHASRGDILTLIEAIQPHVLMPVHSFNPEMIGVPTINRIIPQYGTVYTREDLATATPPTEEELGETAKEEE
ncbi:MAG: MBL fold metallo-hydrolase, partial [Tumebacillaceae bacterium]